MSASLLAAPEAQRWLDAITRTRTRLNGILDTFGDGEWDWAPDDGVATAREHLWAVAESERDLTARVTRGVQARPSNHEGQVSFHEMRRILDICDRNLVAWLDDYQDKEIDSELGDAFVEHLELKSFHAGAIAGLSQLIDPHRVSPLLA